MSEESLRRRDDEVLSHFTAVLTAQGIKIDELTAQAHKMEIHMAELKAISGGKVDQIEYRVDRLEANNKTLFGAAYAIITAIAVSVVMWVVQQWGGSGAMPQ